MYVVECRDKSWYCGISTDPERRLKEHNEGSRGAKYTRSRRPTNLVFIQKCNSKSDALKKEAAFKKLTRKKKLEYMCDVIEEEVLAQIAKMEEMNKGNNSIQDTSDPDNNTGQRVTSSNEQENGRKAD